MPNPDTPSVPEPVTTLGSVVAVGFGAFLRKKYSRQLQK
ncbi:MAG: PEP-CTERM sorting domain-containing protein [Gloeotrichia echinulata GP01]